MNFPENSPFSHCSSGLIADLLVLSTMYPFMKVSFSSDIIPSGCLGSKHQLTVYGSSFYNGLYTLVLVGVFLEVVFVTISRAGILLQIYIYTHTHTHTQCWVPSWRHLCMAVFTVGTSLKVVIVCDNLGSGCLFRGNFFMTACTVGAFWM